MISGNLSKTMPQNCITFSNVSSFIEYSSSLEKRHTNYYTHTELISKSHRISVRINDYHYNVTEMLLQFGISGQFKVLQRAISK